MTRLRLDCCFQILSIPGVLLQQGLHILIHAGQLLCDQMLRPVLLLRQDIYLPGLGEELADHLYTNYFGIKRFFVWTVARPAEERYLATPKEIFDSLEQYSSGSFPNLILESMIKLWPSGWGEDLNILIYGDFEPPNEDILIPELGITINHVKKENTPIKSAGCVLVASVKVEAKNLESLIDAIRRINILLGAWTLFKLGHSALGWWSYISHGTSGGVIHKLERDKNLEIIIRNISNLPVNTRKKIDAALYWIREPRNLIRDSYRSDILRIYSAYWNAFECLVDAAHEIIPEQGISKSERKRQKEKEVNDIVDKIKKQNKELTLEDVIECARIVNPGFRAKASHALRVCFPDVAMRLINQCFEIPEKNNRLYQIRNDIDHGNIDAENPEELYRVEQRFNYLDAIVRLMFRRIIMLSIQDTQNDTSSK